MSAYDDPGSRSLIRAVVAGLVVILPLAAAAAGILGYLELPGSWPWEERRLRPYEADLSKPDEATAFREFILKHEHEVVRLALFVPIEQELPDGRTASIDIRWVQNDIKAFRMKVSCRKDIEENRLICHEMQVEFVPSQEARPDFGRVSAGYFSVKGLYAVEPRSGELDPYVVGLRPVRPEDVDTK
jgi:hypothetical protein